MKHSELLAVDSFVETRWLCLALLFTAGVLCPPLKAQIGTVTGGVTPIPGVSAPTAEPVLSDARLLPLTDFLALDVLDRRRIMSAWTLPAALDRANATLLPLIEAGLRDRDALVREHSAGALQTIENAANLARLQKRAPKVDPRSHSPMYSTLVALLDHQDVLFRSQIVRALVLFENPQRADLETEFLERLKKERSPLVRSEIVMGQVEFAKRGSVSARQAVLAALDDSAPEVQTIAISGARQMRLDEALPRIVEKLDSSRPTTRSAVILALDTYGAAAAPYASLLEERLSNERDPRVRAELEKLVEKLKALSPR